MFSSWRSCSFLLALLAEHASALRFGGFDGFDGGEFDLEFGEGLPCHAAEVHQMRAELC